MIPVRHTPHRTTSDNVRGFRNIKHSTYSKQLFTGFGGDKKLVIRQPLKPKFDGFNFGGLKLKGGHLETRWLGQGLDHYAAELFEKLQGGGVLMGFIGNLLASAYRPMRFGIINKLIAMLYQILIEVLTTIHNTIWRIFFVPLLIIAVVLILLPLVDVTIIAQAAWRLSDSIAGVFGSMSSYFTQ